MSLSRPTSRIAERRTVPVSHVVLAVRRRVRSAARVAARLRHAGEVGLRRCRPRRALNAAPRADRRTTPWRRWMAAWLTAAALWHGVPAAAEVLRPSLAQATSASVSAHPNRHRGPAVSPGPDLLSGMYRLKRPPVAGDPGGETPLLEVRRAGSHWLLSQSGATDGPQQLRAFQRADYEAMFAGQVASAKPRCAASAFAAICRVEPGTQPDPDDDFRTSTGYFLFSVDVGVVELERIDEGPRNVVGAADHDAVQR
ncbi:hypothetical protein WAE61_20955 [Comamonadaceae bacterium PP-2]